MQNLTPHPNKTMISKWSQVCWLLFLQDWLFIPDTLELLFLQYIRLWFDEQLSMKEGAGEGNIGQLLGHKINIID